ncbi:unnamed protein product [Miscanthus lutarioriparius]|uniref:Staygreen protein domain-containing protein n=1 Tax=Miscanthus lutarioriparius TaxID=422564 RepID=A0A811QZB2_9POAL|nr:unnamed protein product [Miscanthus lutarioriparius]
MRHATTCPGRSGAGVRRELWPDKTYASYVQDAHLVKAAKILGPPTTFNAAKLKVEFAGVELRSNKQPPPFPGAYTLTHCDFTANLTLAVSGPMTSEQLAVDAAEGRRGGRVEGGDHRQQQQRRGEGDDAAGALLRQRRQPPAGAGRRFQRYVFSKELPLVLKAVVHGDAALFAERPELMEASSTAGISQASPAVHPHPHPLPGEAGAASASPTTTSSSLSLSLSLVASTSLCASSSGSSSSSSAASSSSYLWRRRPRELVLLPNASTSNSMSSREWDVVVLDPKSKSSDSDRCKPISGRGSERHRLAAPTPKRARSVSPLSARPAPPPPPGSYEQQQQHKKRRQNTGRRSTTATQREVVALAQARNEDKKKKTEVSQSQSLRRRLEAKISSSAHADSTTAAALAQVTPDDDLTNPIISMDCFIFL